MRFPISVFMPSKCTFDCEWWPVVRLTVMPSLPMKQLHTCESSCLKCLPVGMAAHTVSLVRWMLWSHMEEHAFQHLKSPDQSPIGVTFTQLVDGRMGSVSFCSPFTRSNCDSFGVLWTQATQIWPWYRKVPTWPAWIRLSLLLVLRCSRFCDLYCEKVWCNVKGMKHWLLWQLVALGWWYF